ncbi:hypothetical protein ACFV94_03690 [Streptomyces sp. NPDC059896]|uniref:hypothetical protein n=1 Tax=Streptomyces sp. NPDC059896 TaxID=3346993 RepID=UPI0036606BD6
MSRNSGATLRRSTVAALSIALGALSVPSAVAGTATTDQKPMAPAPRSAQATQNIGLGSWMEQLKGTIGDRPLNQIVMPGSHDAGTAGITKDSGICSYGDQAEAARVYPALAASMARSQTGSLAEQLEGGSRYLDLRLCKQGDKWFTFHGGPMGRQFFDSFAGAQSGIIKGEINELADWIKRHPKEIVIIRLQTAVPPETAKEVNRAAIAALGGAIGGGPLDNPAIADGTLSPASTYNQFMAAGKSVVFIDDTDSTSYPWAWGPSAQSFRGSYVDVGLLDLLPERLWRHGGPVSGSTVTQKNIEAVLARGDKVFEQAPGGNSGKFFVYEGILNPTANLPDAGLDEVWSTIKNFGQTDRNFLLKIGHELNRQMLDKFRKDWNHTNVTDNMNIIMTDDVNMNEPAVPSGELQREIISKNLGQKVTPHTFYNATRKTDGTWSAPSPLSGAGNSFRFVGSRQAVSGMPNGDVQVLGIGLDGNIWHNLRGRTGTWQGWNALPAADGTKTGFAAKDIAIAGFPNGDAQIVAVGKDGLAYHNVRRNDGSWQGWRHMTGTEIEGVQASKVAVAGMPDGSAHVVTYGADGTMRRVLRAANGSWGSWTSVPGVNASGFVGRALTIAALPNGDTQIAAIGNDGNIWHTIRLAKGGWTGWNGPAGVSTPMMGASEISLTSTPDGDSQMLAVGLDGNVYHTVRARNGDWTPFRPVGGIKGAGTLAGDQVGIAGMPDGSSQVILTTR